VDGLREDISCLREVVQEKDAEMAEMMSMITPAAAAPVRAFILLSSNIRTWKNLVQVSRQTPKGGKTTSG